MAFLEALGWMWKVALVPFGAMVIAVAVFAFCGYLFDRFARYRLRNPGTHT